MTAAGPKTKREPRGLHDKYVVLRTRDLPPMWLADNDYKLDGAIVREECFVLKLDDRHARNALRAYANSCQSANPTLAKDLRAWISDHLEAVDVNGDDDAR